MPPAVPSCRTDRTRLVLSARKHVLKLVLHVRDAHRHDQLTVQEQSSLIAAGVHPVPKLSSTLHWPCCCPHHLARSFACAANTQKNPQEPTRQQAPPPLPPPSADILERHKALLLLPGVTSALQPMLSKHAAMLPIVFLKFTGTIRQPIHSSAF